MAARLGFYLKSPNIPTEGELNLDPEGLQPNSRMSLPTHPMKVEFALL